MPAASQVISHWCAKCADISKSLAADWMTMRPVGGAIAKCADISKPLAADWLTMGSGGGAIH